jgi:hypothetical protein
MYLCLQMPPPKASTTALNIQATALQNGSYNSIATTTTTRVS